jgi:NTP pyrophosphatase (non-canonical NTP hydrolase)
MVLDISPVPGIDEWLDNGAGAAYQREPLAQDWARISKVAEELGEATQAFIGYTGQNPRKGYTHTQDDVLYELADVVLTAILAIQHFTKDQEETESIINFKIQQLKKRVPNNG